MEMVVVITADAEVIPANNVAQDTDQEGDDK